MAGTDKEIGWQKEFDEGIRLMTNVETLAGLKATLTLPSEYDSPYNYSYFNFYLGMNFPNGLAVEAGISYSNIHGSKLWRVFTNPGQSLPFPSPPGSVEMALYLVHLASGQCVPTFVFDGRPITCGAAGARGKIKMVGAIHEDISDTTRRKTWFNSATFRCTGVLVEPVQAPEAFAPTGSWKPYSAVSDLVWHVQRPPEPIHKLISCPNSVGDNFTLTMAKPSPPA